MKLIVFRKQETGKGRAVGAIAGLLFLIIKEAQGLVVGAVKTAINAKVAVIGLNNLG